MGQRGTRRERQLARVLVLLGVFGVLALAAGGFYAGRTLWRLRMPHKSFTMAKEVYIDGCEHAYLYEPWKPDAGGLKGVSHYTLTCIGGHSSTPLPTCDKVELAVDGARRPRPADARSSRVFASVALSMQLRGVTLLEALLSLDRDAAPNRALELFVSHALFDAGVWSSPRTSDGVAAYRILERGPMRVCAVGKIWTIDQTQHVFWLDIERGAAPASSTWTLHFDVDASTMGPRRARLAFDVLEDPEDVPWLHTLAGRE